MAFLTNEGASSSSFSSTHRWDVFLSFRGEDTRNNFTSHLYKALCDRGFNTFIDNNLQKGEEISMELLKVIELSMISIVVFSKNFATSTWCMDELVKIFERRSNGLLVVPIFYKVDPSEIRFQHGDYGIALSKHEVKFRDDMEKVQRWRKTLTEASNLSGFPYKDGVSEFEFIQTFIKEISCTNGRRSFVAKYPIGTNIRAKDIELPSDMEVIWHYKNAHKSLTRNMGFQCKNLKIIDLSRCKSLTKLPNLCSPNLEELKLVFCENLIEVDESFGFLMKLKIWNLHGCSQLQILPSTLMLKSLRYFDLEGCSRLEKFPNIHPKMKYLKKLYLFSSGIRELPSSLLYLTGLDTLRLASCDKLTDFLVRANKSQMQEEVDFPSANLRLACNSFNNFLGPTGFLSLTELNLNGCVGIKVELDSWMQPDYFPVLTLLHLGSTGIVTIPESISRFTRLKYLYIRDCKKLQEIPKLPQSIRTVNAQNCYRLDPQSSCRLWNQFGEIIGILPNTVTQAVRSSESKIYHFLILPTIEIPKWFKFNHHQSVGNSVSFLVGPRFSNLVVCIAFPSKDVNTNMGYFWSVKISINGCKQQNICQWYDNYQSKKSEKKYDNYDHVWLIYGEVNITNPFEENRIEVEVIGEGMNISLNRMRIYVECVCCPQKPNISPASSMDQWAFNNGEENLGRVRI